MEQELSPALERARDAALALAREAGAPFLRINDWLLAFLADDEGKPAALLQRMGVELEMVRSISLAGPTAEAPADRELFKLGRAKALELRGDPTLTTEFVFLAVLTSNAEIESRLAELGLVAAILERHLHAGHLAPVEVREEPGPALAIFELPDRIDTARSLDANLNRSRESLRVLDDFCRFHRNDKILTEHVKGLRHELAAVAETLPKDLLLSARNTPGDVGTEIGLSSEYTRKSPTEVALVNLKRLQESLRSLEEFGKVLEPSFGKKVEALRYRTYSLEQSLAFGGRDRLSGVKLYALLTGSQCEAALDWTIAEAAAGGVQMIQLREKTLTDRELLEKARNVRKWTRQAKVLFLVNDRPDIARLSEADGVHLGQDDLPVAAARRILGPEAIIGVSTHNPDQLRRAVLDGADYVGIGPVFPSATKEFDAFPGLEFVRFASAETSLPAFALGGITPANLELVQSAGGKRIAVASVIARAEDPQSVARTLRSRLDS